MKKLLMLLMTLSFLMVLVACDNEEPIESEPTETEVEGPPNGLRPLEVYPDCEVPILDGDWTCVWADEFDGTALDETKWNIEVNGDGGGNQELQYYRRENIEVKDGKLVITAKKEDYLGKSYTSGRINTKYKGRFQYVRIVVSAKLPEGRGTWPAIWMMPLMNVYGGWPNSGEIDIMEYVGYQPNTIYSTIHTRAFNHNLGTQIGYNITVPEVEEQFNTYEMIWTPGQILTYVNDVQVGNGFRYVPVFNQDIPYHYAFPFDQEFFLIMNFAVGGSWGGVQGVDSEIFPQTFEVDYVRVYQQDYAVLDTEIPSVPSNLQLATLRNTVFWNASTDDYGVEGYEIYLDGVYHKTANLNQFTLTGLTDQQAYQVQIRAIDFVGRVSALSSPMTVIYRSS